MLVVQSAWGEYARHLILNLALANRLRYTGLNPFEKQLTPQSHGSVCSRFDQAGHQPSRALNTYYPSALALTPC